MTARFSHAVPGWGINLAHQGDTIFATWFTFGSDGKPLWLVGAASKTANGVYSGMLYTGTGPTFSSVPFDPTKVVATVIGTATLTFTDNDTAKFDYTVNGVSQTKQITREQFGPSMPTCTWGAVQDLALAPNYQGMWWAAPANSESGWGINFAHHGDTVFATWSDGNSATFRYTVNGISQSKQITREIFVPPGTVCL